MKALARFSGFSISQFLNSHFPLSPSVPRGYTRPEGYWNFHQIRKSLPMSWYRYLFLPLLVGLVVVITGALAQQTAPPPKSKNPAQAAGPKVPPPKSDAKAAKILDEAVKKLDLSETPWIKAKIWQRVDTQSLAFTAEGDYRAGPDQR